MPACSLRSFWTTPPLWRMKQMNWRIRSLCWTLSPGGLRTRRTEEAPGKEQNADKRKQRPAVQDRMQASLLRRDLSHLDQLHEEKDLFIQKTRAELRACRRRMGLLAKQQESVAADLAAERAAGNTAAVGRLEAASQRLCSELGNERDLQAKMTAVLQESVRSVCLQTERGLRRQKLVEDAQKNHRKAVKFLKASLGRVREQQREEAREARERMRRRRDAVLALKNSISASRETLRKFQAWGQAKAELAEQKAQAEKEVILAQGGDAFKHFCHQRRRQELEAQNRAFAEEQKLRKHEIVRRISKEEAEEGRRKQRPPPPRPAGRPTLRGRTWSYVAAFHAGKSTAGPPCCPPESRSALPQASLLVKAVSSESVQADGGSLGRAEETLARPEIPGLWKEDYKPYQVPKEDMDQKPVGGTKMDKDVLACTVQRLHSGVIRKQVASRHEFRGCPFNSKPKLVHFKVNKDLEGNVSFLAQTGRFSVPLKCSTKKCSLSLDKELIDFGSYVVGETASRTITLTSLGGLGTRFRFLLASECCDTDTSPSALSTVSVLLLLAGAVTAPPRAACGVSCPETQPHECTGGHVDVGGRRPSSGAASGQSR
eukprot:bmy_10054T0